MSTDIGDPGGNPAVTLERQAELASALQRLEDRLLAAAAAAGRQREELTVVAVTKTRPATDLAALAVLGVTELGENRAAELADKRAALPGLPVRWHFVGQVQSRQSRRVAELADVVHSVDRAELAERLGRAARMVDRTVEVFLQVSLDGDPNRGGAAVPVVPDLADTVESTGGLRLVGLMAVPPLGSDPSAAYADLRAVADTVRAAHPAACMLSAGMSGDLEAAVAAGATHLRVGTALLGGRAAPLG